MALKKQTAIRTGKLVRELMLGDKVVGASTIMVYSSNDINEEIKIENMSPSSNQDIFSSEDIDWNKAVIYKIVDFVGNVEVGKVILQDIKRNHVTLTIERIMWTKEPNQEKVTVDVTPKQEAEIEKETEVNVESTAVAPAPVPKAKATEKPKQQKIAVEETQVKKVVPTTVATPQSNENSQHYQRLLHLSMTICSQWDLGIDLTDTMEQLKEELKQQGVSSYFDKETADAIETLRTLKENGVKLESLLSIL